MKNMTLSYRHLWKTVLSSSIIFLLILLWSYAAVSKLADYSQARTAMLNQVFSRPAAEVLTWLMPSAELFTALLLVFSRTQRAGLVLSILLMLAFTGYILLVLAGIFNRIPCSCGGILQKMSWQAHLAFNLAILALTIAGVAIRAGKSGYP